MTSVLDEATAALFSSALFRPLVTKGDSRRLDAAMMRYRALSRSRARTNATTLRSAYRRLVRHYPVDYVYRNALVRELFLNGHSDQDVCLQELRIGDSIADAVIVNGDGVVYEIKSEFDSPTKLTTQIRDYYTAFTTVNVVVHPSQVGKYRKHLPWPQVGLLTYEDGVLSTERAPEPNVGGLQVRSLFELLRVTEAREVLTRLHGEVPDVPNTRRYRAWLELAEHTPVERFQHAVQEALKQRTNRVFHRLRSRPSANPLDAVIVQLNPDSRGFDRCETWLHKEPASCTTPTFEANSTNF